MHLFPYRANVSATVTIFDEFNQALAKVPPETRHKAQKEAPLQEEFGGNEPSIRTGVRGEGLTPRTSLTQQTVYYTFNFL